MTMATLISTRGLSPFRQRIRHQLALHAPRQFLSTTSTSASDSTRSSGETNEKNLVVLYERDESRNNLPRASFLVSSGNLLYWIWYVFDFVPAVNTSTVADLHVDPAYGFGGLGLSVLIHSMFTLYPLSLISKLGYQPSSPSGHQGGQVLVWKHTLPFVNASSAPITKPLGSITMDKASSDTSKILNDYKGDLRQYQGHLGIQVKDGYIPLLMEIRQPSEVHDAQLLLEVLLDPDRLQQSRHKNERHHAGTDGRKSRKSRGKRGKRR